MFLLKWENEVIFHIGMDSQIISRLLILKMRNKPVKLEYLLNQSFFP